MKERRAIEGAKPCARWGPASVTGASYNAWRCCLRLPATGGARKRRHRLPVSSPPARPAQQRCHRCRRISQHTSRRTLRHAFNISMWSSCFLTFKLRARLTSVRISPASRVFQSLEPICEMTRYALNMERTGHERSWTFNASSSAACLLCTRQVLLCAGSAAHGDRPFVRRVEGPALYTATGAAKPVALIAYSSVITFEVEVREPQHAARSHGKVSGLEDDYD